MSNTIINLTDPQSLNSTIVGGKAASLAKLLKSGFNVPTGFVIKADASLEPVSILIAFDKLASPYVAVRSSATLEDSEDSSWAGQFTTVLGVKRDKLMEAMAHCRQSINSKPAKVYAKYHNLSSSDQKMAVIVQVLVNSEISGVMFTANPINNNHNQVVIETVFGLGEILVQGLVTPESMLVDKSSGKILSRTLHNQTRKLVFKKDRIVEVNLSKALRNRAILTKNHVEQLLDIARKIELSCGSSRDVEFAIAENQIYILQSRPITTA